MVSLQEQDYCNNNYHLIKSTHAESDKASDSHFVVTRKCSENYVIAVHVQKSVEMQVPSYVIR